MAKSNSFFGKRRGSTKNFTFTVFNGKQVTKEKAESVKNPRTLAQMRNRMVLTTSSAAYAAMKEIVDHSFEGYTYGLQNMSRFQSVNNKLLRENIGAATPAFAFCEYGKAKLLPGAYQVSEGSLAPIPTAYSYLRKEGDTSLRWVFDALAAGSQLTANAIISDLGLRVGSLATLVTIATKVVSSEVTSDFTFVFVRVHILKAGSEVITADNFSEFFKIEANCQCQVGFDTNYGIYLDLDASMVYPGGTFSWAVIKSELVNGSWERSDAVMALVGTIDSAHVADAALATYPVGASYILNNGDVSGGYDIEPTPAPEP